MVVINRSLMPRATGGGETTKGEYNVLVVDYDGTVLDEKWLNTGDTYTLPANPTGRDKLVFQEWSCSQDIINNTITIEDNDVMVGAIYTTTSGLSEFDIEITKAIAPNIETDGFTVTLNMDGNKYWDYANDSSTSDTETTHTYYAYGKYTIACDGTAMITSDSSGLFGQTTSAGNSYVNDIRFSNIAMVTAGAVVFCKNLRTLSLPSGLTAFNSNMNGCNKLVNINFPYGVTQLNSTIAYLCYNLKTVTVPNSVTQLSTAFRSNYLTSIVVPKSVVGGGGYTFSGSNNIKKLNLKHNEKIFNSINMYLIQSCPNLETVELPTEFTEFPNSYAGKIPDYCFYNCRSLKEVKLPSNTRSIGGNVFYGCFSLKEIFIPSAVTSLYTNVFYNCYALTKYDFSEHTAVPTLSNTNAFTNINQLAKIYVPDELYDTWITATNWSTYANYIYKASEKDV